jgi:hypothetical protein
MSKWIKLLQLLLPAFLICAGVLHALAILVGSGLDTAISQFGSPFIFIFTGLVLGDINKRRKDLN